VPLSTLGVESLVPTDVIDEPGANKSTQEPKFENDARASVDVVAPTVSAFAAEDGE
jgi:hypothetical protein